MQEQKIKYVREIEPYLAYALKRYISEQKEHIDFMHKEIFTDLEEAFGRNESMSELNVYQEMYNSYFGELEEKFTKHYEEQQKEIDENYQDPDSFCLVKINEITREYMFKENNSPDFAYELNHIEYYTNLDNDSDDKSETPYFFTWEETEVSGCKASKMITNYHDGVTEYEIKAYEKMHNAFTEYHKTRESLGMHCLIKVLIGVKPELHTEINFIMRNLKNMWV